MEGNTKEPCACHCGCMLGMQADSSRMPCDLALGCVKDMVGNGRALRQVKPQSCHCTEISLTRLRRHPRFQGTAFFVQLIHSVAVLRIVDSNFLNALQTSRMTYVGFQHRATIICGLLNLFHADVGAVPNPASQLRRRADLVPLLATIKNTPELSVFYSLFNSTGGKRIPLSLYRMMLIRAPGDSGIPGPQLEERFNDPKVGLEFTAFAPTNDVR